MDRSNVVPTVHNHLQYYAVLHKTTNGSCHFDIIVLQLFNNDQLGYLCEFIKVRWLLCLHQRWESSGVSKPLI